MRRKRQCWFANMHILSVLQFVRWWSVLMKRGRTVSILSTIDWSCTTRRTTPTTEDNDSWHPCMRHPLLTSVDRHVHTCMHNAEHSAQAFTHAHTPAAVFERPLVFVKVRRQSFVSFSVRFILLEVDGSLDSDVQIGRNSVLLHLSSFKYRQISLILKKKRGLITSGCVTCV